MHNLLFVEHIIPLLQHVLVFLGLAYLFTKTPVFTALVNNSLTLPDKAIIYLVFSGFCILGTSLSELSVQSEDAIANTRGIGAVLGGLLGGPVVGFFVGLTGGVHRVWSMTAIDDPIIYIDLACAVSTTYDGLFAGFVHYYLSRKGRIESLFSPLFIWLVALTIGLGHVFIFLLFGWAAGEAESAWRIQKEITLAMLLANPAGVALIMYMIREQKRACDDLSSSATAWRIANKTAGIMLTRFSEESSQKIAEIIHQETRVGAVAITDRNKLLAFTGEGKEHHQPGSLISSKETLKAINKNKVIFVDGVNKSYQCQLDPACNLGSVLIIPLNDDANREVIGTIKLYDTKQKIFRTINRKLGESVAQLLSNRILAGRYERQHELRIEDQYKLLTMQVNPHFLYNALTTISHITKNQPKRARELLNHLSDFFRTSLESCNDTATLREELSHVESYLEIEKARFENRLQVHIDIPDCVMDQVVPVFTLQPIVENAIKHGTSEMLGVGVINISCVVNNDELTLIIEDNAGLYVDNNHSGIGLKIEERIKIRYGPRYGITVMCEPDQWTKVLIRLPYNEKQAL
ncbi:Sensor histidine kinase YehU [hydrothermal vent metagenome]|uniref:histidine kinase n=1 Tax=hydrothermal vent metagenome TaxID=652676 RepID=A0A3B0Z1T9_9ZZZZ